MEELTSLDYARLIQFAAQKNHKVLLNRTQINKILFYVYGLYIAKEEQPLFKNEVPKAWPYGPVFPYVNENIDTDEIIKKFSPDKVKAYRENKTAMDIVVDSVKKLHKINAYKLTEWSHKKGSPWYDTLFGDKKNKWNTPIDDELIKKYFKKEENIL